ncbi:hypothetical protein [Rubellicoccus peritrichatus]|uniref:Uncharacterized protein n=1 Tax=Rubellicoccus peritrichatus TaxID=3080537 RepID=A0AAQ3QRS1_9BACT|nr:hypothetical protein [Puniceicoccus sp. CR14]WOO41573.1 hypothetical protein RZN69_00630 [Puniceicoccus sp. CR14]
MRALIITLLSAFTLLLFGCKYPDNVQLHPHVRQDVGGPVKFHEYVEEDYRDFADWANPAAAPSASDTSDSSS